jgi:hypothetical protein
MWGRIRILTHHYPLIASRITNGGNHIEELLLFLSSFLLFLSLSLSLSLSFSLSLSVSLGPCLSVSCVLLYKPRKGWRVLPEADVAVVTLLRQGGKRERRRRKGPFLALSFPPPPTHQPNASISQSCQVLRGIWEMRRPFWREPTRLHIR